MVPGPQPQQHPRTRLNGIPYFLRMMGEMRVILCRRKASQPWELPGKNPRAEKMGVSLTGGAGKASLRAAPSPNQARGVVPPGSEGMKHTGPRRKATCSAGGREGSPSDPQSASPEPRMGQLCNTARPPSHRWGAGLPPEHPPNKTRAASHGRSPSLSQCVGVAGEMGRGKDALTPEVTGRAPHTSKSPTKRKEGLSAGTGSAWALRTHGPHGRRGDRGSSCRLAL